jgi:chromosome partitioning protein
MAQSVINILVVNSKGGCGKTTVATNLAAAYANEGKQVALFDFDRQASAQHWAGARGLDLPNIDLYHRPDPAKIDHDAMGHYDVCVFDSGPGIATQPSLHAEFEALLRLSDVIVVPMLSSAWDIQAGEHFITQLMTQRVWRAAHRPIAVVGNRISGNLAGQQKLQHFLSCLDVPAVSQFRESPVYAEAGDSGQGIVEMKRNRAARKEFKAWYTLTGWIDEATLIATSKRLPAMPLAASRADRLTGDDATTERA